MYEKELPRMFINVDLISPGACTADVLTNRFRYRKRAQYQSFIVLFLYFYYFIPRRNVCERL